MHKQRWASRCNRTWPTVRLAVLGLLVVSHSGASLTPFVEHAQQRCQDIGVERGDDGQGIPEKGKGEAKAVGAEEQEANNGDTGSEAERIPSDTERNP